ncbi:hypothetical protein EIP86_001793 [Pleurotus ostreatoroseus]|nr:hypothetical protein EIP86_001793 [Pleurotus ostreatoroseus]
MFRVRSQFRESQECLLTRIPFVTKICQEIGEECCTDTTIASWMLHRSTFTVARVDDWTKTKYDPPEFEEMMAAYERLTCFQWPKDWATLGKIPRVDKCLAVYRRRLYNEYKARYSEARVEYLTDDQANIMASRLSLLLKSVDGAYTKEARLPLSREAESRHDFDALFANFFVDDVKQVTSPDVFFECQLRLPRNALLDELRGVKPADHAKKLRKHLQHWQLHNSRVYEHFLENETDDPEHDATHEELISTEGDASEPTPTLTEQSLQSWNASGQLVAEFNQLYPTSSRSTTPLKLHVEGQSRREPLRGTCDAILVTSIPLPEGEKALAAYNASKLVFARYRPDGKSATESEGVQVQVPPAPTLPNETQQQKTTGQSRTAKGNKAKAKGSGQTGQTTRPDSGSSNSNTRQQVSTQKGSSAAYKLYQFPLTVESGDYEPYKPEPVPNVYQNTTKCVMLPQLSVEYKCPSDDETKALNQCRMYVSAAVESSTTMGIIKYPMFTLAVHGTRAALLMGWRSSDGATYIVERNVRKFDLLQPLQAFHLATIVLRLKARDVELKELYTKDCEDYRKKLQEGVFDKWAMPEPKEKEDELSVPATSTPPIATPTATAEGTPLVTLHEISETDSQGHSEDSEGPPEEDSEELPDSGPETQSGRDSEAYSERSTAEHSIEYTDNEDPDYVYSSADSN